MTWLVDPETRELLPAVPRSDNWPPKPLPIYADFDYEKRLDENPDSDDGTDIHEDHA